MPNQEYEKLKQERDDRDKKRSMIIFPLVILSLIAGIVIILIKN